MQKRLKIFLIIAFVGAFFGPSFFGYIKNSQNLYIYNDDAVQYIPPFFHYQKNYTMAPDYANKYYLDVIYPAGYKTLFIIFSKYFSPIILSKILPYFTFFVLLVAAGMAMWKFGGEWAVFSVICLILSGEIFLSRMGGGLPRAFGFPVLALALAAGVYGRLYLLAAITVIGAIFYPVTAVIAGVFLAGLLLVPVKFTEVAKDFSFKKRVILLCITAMMSAVFIIPQMMRGGEYGDKISLRNIISYSEAEIGGRYSYSESITHTFFLYNFIENVDGLLGKGRSDIFLSFALSGIGLIFLLSIYFFIKAWKEKNYFVVRYSLFFVSALICYLASVIFLPYLYFPERYLTYTLPLFYVTIIPIFIFNSGIKFKPIVLVASTCVMVALFGGRVNSLAGLTVNVEKYKPMYDYVNTLPGSVLVAGWPQKIYIDGLKYITRKDVFLSYETHQALHAAYADKMREKTYALTDAYLATDLDALIKFRDKFGVNYLIADMSDFENVPPVYFQPFDKYIEEKWQAAKQDNKPFVLPSLKDKAVFAEGGIFILDLSSF